MKAADVAWVSNERCAARPNDPAYLIAPEICVGTLSPANSAERKRLFFQKGALEFWMCSLEGEATFFDPGGKIPPSRICPAFPKTVTLE